VIVHYELQGNPIYMPYRKYAADGAYDLCAIETQIIPPHSFGIVDTGLRVRIPKDFVGMVLSRSGLAAQKGVFVLNSPGIIDSGYSDTIKVILGNMSDQPYETYEGGRLCQFLIMPLADYILLPGKVYGGERGKNGLGSTGGIDPEY